MELDIRFRMEIRWIGDDDEEEEEEAGARVCGSVRETEEVKQFWQNGKQKTVDCSIKTCPRLRIYYVRFFLS